MRECVFDNQELADKAVELFAEKGWKLACISNLGLRPGLMRYTFLPASVFKESEESAKASSESEDS